jgi:hypothetical protein
MIPKVLKNITTLKWSTGHFFFFSCHTELDTCLTHLLHYVVIDIQMFADLLFTTYKFFSNEILTSNVNRLIKRHIKNELF